MSHSFADYLAACRRRIDQCLESGLLQGDVQPANLQDLFEACHYGVANGGKRVRPLLVYAAANACGYPAPDASLDYLALAAELVHSYSLVHDDLPAMDDDDLRRGKPSLHRAYDEATAVLVGDGLQARAFELIADAPGLSASQRVKMVRAFARAAGPAGMVGGQYVDIQATDTYMALEQLQAMHRLKTGELIRASLALGAIAADASSAQESALELYGSHIGLAFQVVDDILDVAGDQEAIGKTSGKDAQANKPTYVKLLGMDGARAEATRLLEAALATLQDFGESADRLRDLARYIVQRDR